MRYGSDHKASSGLQGASSQLWIFISFLCVIEGGWENLKHMETNDFTNAAEDSSLLLTQSPAWLAEVWRTKQWQFCRSAKLACNLRTERTLLASDAFKKAVQESRKVQHKENNTKEAQPLL